MRNSNLVKLQASYLHKIKTLLKSLLRIFSKITGQLRENGSAKAGQGLEVWFSWGRCLKLSLIGPAKGNISI